MPSYLSIFVSAAILAAASICPNQGVLAQGSIEAPATGNHVGLPEQIAIIAPDAGVAEGLAAFSGAWAGDGWNGMVPSALVVERIDQDGSAQVIFAWGDVAATKRARGWMRLTAAVKQGKLGFSIPDYGTAEFNVATDGRLFGRFALPTGRREYILLKRVAAADRDRIIAASESMLSGEGVTFPVVAGPDQKQTVQLRGILYRSEMPGRRPLVVFCGDSAVSGVDRARPNRAPIRSRQMLGLGYSVLVLQRKGMGGSDGPLMEPGDESISQQAQLQSALDDLDAAVRFMKQQEYVDPSRVVVMGIYRGGLLSAAYAGLHDGAAAGVVNMWGHWRVQRSWWQQLLTWRDFTADQFAASSRTKVPMLWVYGGGTNPAALEYARANYRAFTYQGGRGTFLDVSDDGKAGSSNEPLADKVEKAIAEYIQALK